MATDFTERFCATEAVSAERWHGVLLRRSLYPHARLLRPLLVLFNPEFFAADRDFLNGVGRLTRRGDFAIEADEFAHHPANQGFWRRVLRLRVSVRRLHLLFIRALAEEARTVGDERLRAANRSP